MSDIFPFRLDNYFSNVENNSNSNKSNYRGSKNTIKNRKELPKEKAITKIDIKTGIIHKFKVDEVKGSKSLNNKQLLGIYNNNNNSNSKSKLNDKKVYTEIIINKKKKVDNSKPKFRGDNRKILLNENKNDNDNKIKILSRNNNVKSFEKLKKTKKNAPSKTLFRGNRISN
jgi:hypothetical protein